MKKALTLSIIIPVYNEQDYLALCLDAIEKQNLKPDEVIVIDNNSTDNTLKIAKKYPFVKIINEKKQGALFARTTGFNAAKSDIIGRIDADTRIEPNWTERVIEDFQDASVAAITGSSHFYDMPLSPWNHLLEDFFKNMLYKYENNFPFLFGANMAIRKSAWDKIEKSLCQDTYIFEDADMAIHLRLINEKILYDTKLRSGMSARRFSDNPAKFHRYIRLQSITYKNHGMHSIGSGVAIAAYGLGYMIGRPLILAYDPKTNKRSLKKLIKPETARPHPFD